MIHPNICIREREKEKIYIYDNLFSSPSPSFDFRLFSLVMASESNVDSTTDTAASSLTQLFLNEINRQDVNGLLHVQTALLVEK